MSQKEFRAESRRLLELMIHSIYTHKEIFLRELISNASDALDKLHYRGLTDGVAAELPELAIAIEIDRDNRRLIIRDNGIGMTEQELEDNLGVIAKSGSLAFKSEHEANEDVDIIGQFGVGFYSAFMVSDRVTVRSRAYGSEQAYRWQSSGSDGYIIEPCEKKDVGTEVVLELKADSDEEHYDEFLESYRIQELIKKYSDYIRYPIRMDVTRRHLKEGTRDEYEDVTENIVVNSRVPIWKRTKTEVTQEDYDAFYREKFFDFEPPARVIRSSTEGTATYQALLFIPAHTPFDYYSKEYEKGLQLYASGVLIMDRCADLLPDYFSFVKGLVDSQDLSLNISREMLQHDRQLKLIASRLEKKIKSELQSMLNNDREAYEKFFRNFGLQLKFGVYNDYGEHKELLQDLLLFYSSTEKKLVTLEEYISRMQEGQKYIYYASGDTVEKLEHLPQSELLRDKGYEILYLTDQVDEFALKVLHEYGEKEFKSVTSGELGIEEAENSSETAAQDDHKALYEFMGEALAGKVDEVRASKILKTHPVCLTAKGELSLEMEKILNAMPGERKVKANRVLEVNENHLIFPVLSRLLESDQDKLKVYCDVLYGQALMIEGLPVEDPVAFASAVCDIMAQG